MIGCYAPDGSFKSSLFSCFRDAFVSVQPLSVSYTGSVLRSQKRLELWCTFDLSTAPFHPYPVAIQHV